MKTNAMGLDIRNLMKSSKYEKESVTQFSVNLGYFIRMSSCLEV